MNIEEQAEILARQYKISQIDALDILKAVMVLIDEGLTYRQSLEYILQQIRNK